MVGWRKRKSGSVDAPACKPPTQQTLRCSFCNKAQADVRKLIAGPIVFICDECVDVCVDIIADDLQIRPRVSARDHDPRRVSRSLAQDGVACGLCDKPTLFNEVLAIENRGVLCGECADAVEDALAQGRPAS